MSEGSALFNDFRGDRDQREGSGYATAPFVFISGGPTYERAILGSEGLISQPEIEMEDPEVAGAICSVSEHSAPSGTSYCTIKRNHIVTIPGQT